MSRRAIALALLCAALGGCGIASTPATTPTPRSVPPASAGPIETLRAFATAYINWSATTISEQMRALATQSMGQARAAVELAAAQSANDYELQRGGISNHGKVEAIARLSDHRNEYVVVTRETTSSTNTAAYQGLRPAWHLALATVTQLGSGRWVVSRWQPES